MFSNSSTSLVPPNNNSNNKNDNQYLWPAYSCDHLLAPPCYYSHYQSEPNVTIHFNDQVCINIKYLFIDIFAHLFITFHDKKKSTLTI